MSCLVVTRSGFGDVWRFENRQAALRSLLVQPGDAVLAEPADIYHEYTVPEWDRLLTLVGGDLATRLRPRLEETRLQPSRLFFASMERDYVHEDIWRQLDSMARNPPTDPATIVELAQRDRDRDLKERKMAEAQTAAAAKPAKAPKAPKPEKVPTERLIGGLPVATRITFGTFKKKVEKKTKDKDGKAVTETTEIDTKYDAKDNNPKRGGAAARFSNYKHNMTIEQALASGINAGDVKWDLEKGFIVPVQKAA